MPPIPPTALNKAMAMLSRRALSSDELLVKLRSAGFEEAECERAVATCRERHYLDDAQLAADCVEMLRSRNAGARKIRQKLLQRGLADQLTGGLPEADTEQAEEAAAQRALETKWRQLAHESDPRKKREKAFRFLAGRGFASGLIFKVLARVSELPPEENSEF